MNTQVILGNVGAADPTPKAVLLDANWPEAGLQWVCDNTNGGHPGFTVQGFDQSTSKPVFSKAAPYVIVGWEVTCKYCGAHWIVDRNTYKRWAVNEFCK